MAAQTTRQTPTIKQTAMYNDTEYRKASPTCEMRTYTAGTMEVRSKDDGKKMLRGYAMKFDQRYDLGWFTESISRGALDSADMTDVRALLNHDPNFVLGRTTAGTLRLSVDETGLMYEIDLPDTQAARDLAVSIERGDISQSSWAFTVYDQADGQDGETWQDGYKTRTINRVARVFDVSPVTYPANPDTSVAKRSAESLQQQEQQQEILNKRRRELTALRAKLF